MVNQNNRKIKNDNNAQEGIAIKKNSVVNSESKNINTFIFLIEYVLLHYDYDDCDHAQYPIRASLNAILIVSLNLYDDGPTVVYIPYPIELNSKISTLLKSRNKMGSLIVPTMFYKFNSLIILNIFKD